MNKKLIALLFILKLLLSHTAIAASITQCTQPDGTIEFTNQGCSKSNRLDSRIMYRNDSNQPLVTITWKKNIRKSAAFRQPAFVQLQDKLVMAETLQESEQHARTITEKVRSHAQKGKLKTAYDMVAATYVKLSKHLKKRHWEGQKVNVQNRRIRALFEEILITQSSISSADELHQAIEIAWQKHQTNY
ncbi:MAG: hypothetical protein KAI22_10030 [Gammaproteobacteria bacterium]|nr:hypothetical protein [Gammaproteobacteria bacterium]